MKNIKSLSLIITTFVLLVGFASCSILPTEEPYVQPPVLESVKVEYVMDTIIREDMVIEVQATAHLMSTTQSDVYFEEYGGYIGTIEVKSSQEVKAGDVLITMNTRSLEKQKSLAYYNYARAKLTHSHLVETEADAY